MHALRTFRPRALLGGVALALSSVSGIAAQTGGATREETWWSPTTEDWQRPCLIRWQRTWEDAVAVSRRTGRPILVCVNMDGEIASEHYAGVRYRQPDIARIYEPYVCVIASVYRHTPRDYEETGARVPCPRFGTVTCGEHIRIEPFLHERFMDGQRVAPRHIMVELDGAETFDVFYALDTKSVFETVRLGVDGREFPEPTDVAEPTLAEQVSDPDAAERARVERAYRVGDRRARRELVAAAAESGGDAPVDLLRLAVFDLDAELNRMALAALARAESEEAIGLINEALGGPLRDEERAALIAALERLGERFPRARTLAAVHQGLSGASDVVDLAVWAPQRGGGEYPAPSQLWGPRVEVESRLDAAARSRPDDPDALVAFAEASLDLAFDPRRATSSGSAVSGAGFDELFVQDARDAARRARELGATGWRVDAALAIASWHAGDEEAARESAARAVGLLPGGEEDWKAAVVLELFADGREAEIRRATRAKESWPREWISDVDAAYAVIEAHPHGTDLHFADHYDFLAWMGGFRRAGEVLERGLERFPASPGLHERLRGRVLWSKGVAGLEEAYAERLGAEEVHPSLHWFAGYASLVVAEHHRRSAAPGEALAAYDRGIAHFERAIDRALEERESADHYVAMALAGRARIALEAEEYGRALADLLASFERHAEAAASLDGLGISAVATANSLSARLAEAGREMERATLERALAELDPRLLEPAVFDRPPFSRRGLRPLERAGARER